MCTTNVCVCVCVRMYCTCLCVWNTRVIRLQRRARALDVCCVSAIYGFIARRRASDYQGLESKAKLIPGRFTHKRACTYVHSVFANRGNDRTGGLSKGTACAWIIEEYGGTLVSERRVSGEVCDRLLIGPSIGSHIWYSAHVHF